jgi:hypothetical protein
MPVRRARAKGTLRDKHGGIAPRFFANQLRPRFVRFARRDTPQHG